MAATETRTCERCGEAFTPDPYLIRRGYGKYCSLECSHAARRKRIQARCQFCGGAFEIRPCEEARRGRHCSQTCYDATRAARRASYALTRNCAYCGQRFVLPPERVWKLQAPNLYCSQDCSRHARAAGEQRSCALCGAFFYVPHHIVEGAVGRPGLYCSRQCAAHGEGVTASRRRGGIHTTPRELRQCAQCHIPFEVRLPREADSKAAQRAAIKRFCTRACAHAYSAAHPELSHLWRPDGPRTYAPGFTGALKSRLRRRDGNRCQLCGRPPGKTWGIHHIDERKDDHSPGNLVLLCGSCHTHVHTSRDREQLHWQLIVTMARKIAGYLPPPSTLAFADGHIDREEVSAAERPDAARHS
jgi:hypothetical protein